MALPEHLRTGMRGEQIAARYLRKKGYYIYTSDFATKLGETDIIAIDKKGTYCFIEIKTRSPGGMLPPAEAVDSKKQKKLINNAAAFLNNVNKKNQEIRFDIIEIILHDMFNYEINHIKNAFGQGEIEL